jgi:predicted ATPase
VEILRAVASRERPVVVVIDDIQWAGSTPLGLLDQILSGDEPVEGLLMAVAYREGEMSADHPLSSLVARWQQQRGRPEQLRISNLDQRHLAAMVAEMLHASVESVADLAGSLLTVTHGNPYETVELLNGLRREGVLWPSRSGWQWDSERLERRLAQENVPELLESRVAGMPTEARQVLDAMACLGGEVRLETLGSATGLSAATVQQRLAQPSTTGCWWCRGAGPSATTTTGCGMLS